MIDSCTHKKQVEAFGLYTILPSPILYGALHSKEMSLGGRILRYGREIILQ